MQNRERYIGVNSIEFNRYFKTANSGKSPKDHPSYNKFLADAEKIKLQQINELTLWELYQ